MSTKFSFSETPEPICPHCGKIKDDYAEFGEPTKENVAYTCNYCGKFFTGYVEIRYLFTTGDGDNL